MSAMGQRRTSIMPHSITSSARNRTDGQSSVGIEHDISSALIRCPPWRRMGSPGPVQIVIYDTQNRRNVYVGVSHPGDPEWLHSFASEFGLGGVILFDYDVTIKKYERNIIDKAQVKKLCKEIHGLPSRPLIYV